MIKRWVIFIKDEWVGVLGTILFICFFIYAILPQPFDYYFSILKVYYTNLFK
jgi:hypothetical protein